MAMRRVPRTTAQNSHRSNDVYMENFETALKDMGISDSNPRNTEVSSCHISESVPICGPHYGLTHHVDDAISIVKEWSKGPQNPEGNLIDFSDRNLLCLSMGPNEVAVGKKKMKRLIFKSFKKLTLELLSPKPNYKKQTGGADHSVYTFNMDTGKKDRSLHSKVNYETLSMTTSLTHTRRALTPSN
jgi:hypothetical protein